MRLFTAYLMLAAMAGGVVLPGYLIVSAWGPRQLTHRQLLTWVLPAGVVFFALLGAIGALVAGVGGASWRSAGLIAYVVLLLPAAVKLFLEKRRLTFWGSGDHASLARTAWLTFGVVVIVSFTMSCLNVPDPWQMQFLRDISATKTFGTYPTHDNYFQYVNGAAIADGDPFAKYYGESRLVYPVTSRGMLPGLTYAGLRFVLRAGGREVEESFLCYLQFGLIQNAGLVLALAAVIASCGLGPGIFGLVALAFWSSPYGLMNTYFTWFKFAGAGFALSGVAALLSEQQPTARHFALAGILFGLSTNMHEGNALAVPFLSWAVLRRKPWGALWRVPEIGKWALAVACFVVTLAPWAIVKALEFPPDKILLRQHYLNHLGADTDSTWTSLHFLFTHWSLEQHVVHRVGNVVRAVRLHEWLEVANAPLENALALWMNFRITYVGFVLLPVGVAALCLAWRRRVKSAEFERLGVCSLAGIGVLLLAHFSTWYADMTASLPASLIVMTFAWLVALATGGARWKGVVVALVCFSVLEWSVMTHMIVRQVGQSQFEQRRTTMPDKEMFIYLH